MKSGSEPDFRAQLEALRPYLVRYASLQLRDREAAGPAAQRLADILLADARGTA